MFQAPSKTEKISDQIIGQIRDAILSGRFKPGDRVASEKELVVNFGVSKASVREALRVLEAMGLIEIRKGVSGGVFTAEVEMKTTINSIVNFLYFKSVSVKDITMLRYILEPSIARIATSIITPEDIKELEKLEEDKPVDSQLETPAGIAFHRNLARLTQNPILILIMDFVDNILNDLKLQLDLGNDFYDKVRSMHREVLNCLVRRDGEGAARTITHDLLEVGNYMADIAGTPRFEPAMLGESGSNFGDSDGETIAHGVPTGLNNPQLVEEIQKSGLVFKEIGSGELYVFVKGHDDNPHAED